MVFGAVCFGWRYGMIDFYASERHYVDHIVPVWNALGTLRIGHHFIVPLNLLKYAMAKIEEPGQVLGVKSHFDFMSFSEGKRALVAGVKDISTVQRAGYRHIAFMEHGVGITYGNHSSYAGGRGQRTQVELFLAPNLIVQEKTEKALPGARSWVVGTPKMDSFSPRRVTNMQEGKKVVCVSFHWDGGGVAPEAGSAFNHFKKMLPILARWRGFHLIGHGHPRAMGRLRAEYEKLGIEVVEDFEEVMRRADLYVCDNSSTIYEFLVTGKPVVLLNAPEYRKNVNWGIRFWDFADIGPMVDDPNELLRAVLHTLEYPEEWEAARLRAVIDLYPFLGASVKMAVTILKQWIYGG